MEKEKLEMEERIKLKEIEAKPQIEKDKLEKQGSSGASTHSCFHATRNIRLVPKFEEKEVDKYFLHFFLHATGFLKVLKIQHFHANKRVSI